MTLRTIAVALLLGIAPLAIADTSAGGPSKTTGAPVKTKSGLEYWELKKGAGAEAKAGKMVAVHYTGWLTNGKKFDSSLDRNEPFKFQLGAGDVIKGLDAGLEGMKVGGKRRLTIPPELGYGSADQGVIPPNSTLIFEVELVDVK